MLLELDSMNGVLAKVGLPLTPYGKIWNLFHLDPDRAIHQGGHTTGSVRQSVLFLMDDLPHLASNEASSHAVNTVVIRRHEFMSASDCFKDLFNF